MRHGRAAGPGGRWGVGSGAQAAAGAAERGNARQVRGLGAGRASWASWVLVHSAWFSTWFFDSAFFLSHQMNTVHCKIYFGKKIILNLIKIK